MSSNTLLNIIKEQEIKCQLTPDQRKKCDEFFQIVRVGDFIYPSYLAARLGVNVKTAYLFLEGMKAAGFVRNMYEIYCSDCEEGTGVFRERLTGPTCLLECTCGRCGKKLSITKDIIVLYQVIGI